MGWTFQMYCITALNSDTIMIRILRRNTAMPSKATTVAKDRPTITQNAFAILFCPNPTVKAAYASKITKGIPMEALYHLKECPDCRQELFDECLRFSRKLDIHLGRKLKAGERAHLKNCRECAAILEGLCNGTHESY